MSQYFVHFRATHVSNPENEQQLQTEDNARAFGYSLSYKAMGNSGYNVYVELDTDIEFMEFKLRCS